MTPTADNKYYASILNEDSNITSGAQNNQMLMNLASIDSNSEFTSVNVSASNTINNKNNRKLKRVQQPNQQSDVKDPSVAFIEDNNFMQSQSFFNE